MTTTTIDELASEDELQKEIKRLRAIEEKARKVARYHVAGYGLQEDEPWDANTMLHLMDELAKALGE